MHVSDVHDPPSARITLDAELSALAEEAAKKTFDPVREAMDPPPDDDIVITFVGPRSWTLSLPVEVTVADKARFTLVVASSNNTFAKVELTVPAVIVMPEDAAVPWK